jgi:hypothetical protein
MEDSRVSRSARFTTSRETQFVVALAAFAFLHVFAFSSALPFFNGIDEHLHFDLVQKYSRGFLPGSGGAAFDATTIAFLSEYGSPEYLRGPEVYESGRVPTPEEMRAKRPLGSPTYRALVRYYTSRTNIEAEAPPTYYALGGAWMKLGRMFGLERMQLLYWTRWLNPLLAAAVVVLTYRFLRPRYPADSFRRLGPCVFLAGYPNDLQYGVTPDVLSIGLGALCFFGLVRMREAPRRTAVSIATGLVVGLAFLNKYPNVIFASAAFVLFLMALREASRARTLRWELLHWSSLWLTAAGPAFWWLERNLRLLGSLSGAHRKVAAMGWSYNGLDQILAHPILGVRAWFEFVPTLLRTFWQGEFAWHGLSTHGPAVDTMYIATSIVFLGAAIAGWLRAGRAGRASLRPEGIALLLLAAGVAVLVVLSTLFDYGREEGPLSRAFPYFASGRLIAGTVVPFAILYCNGIERVWSRAPVPWAQRGQWLVLCGVLAIALGWQLTVFHDAFGSSWNWYNAS